MFRALLAYPQESLHKRHLVYCVRVVSVGCTRVKVELTQYTKCRLCGTSWGWASNARNMQRYSFLINWTKSASRWFHYTHSTQRYDTLQPLSCKAVHFETKLQMFWRNLSFLHNAGTIVLHIFILQNMSIFISDFLHLLAFQPPWYFYVLLYKFILVGGLEKRSG
jgi:hypothetical protein